MSLTRGLTDRHYNFVPTFLVYEILTIFFCSRSILFQNSIVAQAYISIKVPNTSIDYGKTDISISCKVNGTFLKSIAVIKLKRSNTEIVAISGSVVQWTDNQLQTRSKVNASTEDVLSSYLHLKIMACDVNNTIDQETYQCELTALKQNGPVITPVSKKVYLNITGIFFFSFYF